MNGLNNMIGDKSAYYSLYAAYEIKLSMVWNAARGLIQCAIIICFKAEGKPLENLVLTWWAKVSYIFSFFMIQWPTTLLL